MIRSTSCILSTPIKQWARNFSVSGVKLSNKPVNEPEQIDFKTILQEEKKTGYITIHKQENLASVHGVRLDLLKDRSVRIYQPAKNAMQSGTDNIGHWEMEFDTRDRWENPLMGWTSTGDPLSNMKNEFRTKEEAITFCERNGLKWYVSESKTAKPERVKNYGVNFAWNKRTRVSTK